MTRHSVQFRHRTFVNYYGFLSFAKNMGKKIGKTISKSSSDKYNQSLLNHAKQSLIDAFKSASKRETGHLIDYKIANKMIKVSKNFQQNESETVTNENDKEIAKEISNERHISLDKRQEIIDNLRLIY